MVNPNAAAGKLRAVADEVVGLRFDTAKLRAFQQRFFTLGRGGKGVVRRVPTPAVFVPFKHGKAGDEGEGEEVVVNKAQPFPQVIAHTTEPQVYPVGRAGHQQD